MPATNTPLTRSQRRARIVSPPAQPRLSQRPLFDDEGSLDARFRAYDEKHPDIYATFKAYAIRLFNAGVRHYGAKAIVEVVRYHRALETVDGDVEEPFRINNVFTSRLARKLADEDPRFNEFFSFRELRSA